MLAAPQLLSAEALAEVAARVWSIQAPSPPALADLKVHALQRLEQQLAALERANNTWTMEECLPDSSPDNTAVNQFLKDPRLKVQVFAWHAERQKDMEHLLADHLIPVKAQVVKQDSPHKLVLTKHDDLAQKRLDRIARCRKLLDGLQCPMKPPLN